MSMMNKAVLINNLGAGKSYLFKVELFSALMLLTVIYAIMSFEGEELKYWIWKRGSL